MNYSAVINLYNQIIAIPNRLRHAPFFFGGITLDKYQDMITFEQFQTVKGWSEYFQLVNESDFLSGRIQNKRFVLTLNWLIDLDHASEIFSGKYEDAKRVTLAEKIKEVRSTTKCKRCSNSGVVYVNKQVYRCSCEIGALNYSTLQIAPDSNKMLELA